MAIAQNVSAKSASGHPQELTNIESIQVLRVSTDHDENRQPDLVSLALRASPASVTHVNLDLTLEISEHTSGLTGGTVRFSLKRADLQFFLIGCEMPVTSRAVASQFQASLSTSREVTQTADAETVRETTASISPGFKVGPHLDGKVSDKETNKGKDGRKVSDKFETDTYLIRTGGGAASPHWIFLPRLGEGTVYGAQTYSPWGVLKINGKTAVLEAEVRVQSKDIVPIGVGGIWPENMTARQNRVFRALALTKLKRTPYISRIAISFYLGDSHA